ncbi:MAG: hypothetical protein ABEI99_07455 [Halobaculum sp.]
MSFVVEVKPSARKANGAVGRYVHRRGSQREFADRDDAEAWADGLSEGRRPVWIRAAHPADESHVDGYLVSRRRDLLDLENHSATDTIDPIAPDTLPSYES